MSMQSHSPGFGGWARRTALFSLVAVLGGWLLAVDAAEEESAIARGGLLYDKWYKVIGADEPKDAHPAYPKDKAYAGKAKDNWRCKECHGWDYQGKDGAYASGKHFSGIKGIAGMKGANPNAVAAVLKDSTHGYGGRLSDRDIQDLALFVARGQIDMDQFIDRKTKSPKGGDAGRGEVYYNTICARCHGMDGMEPKEMKPFGDQMGNPWEVMHKILNGQPEENMPALRALDRQVVIDIMAHMTTLPKKP